MFHSDPDLLLEVLIVAASIAKIFLQALQ